VLGQHRSTQRKVARTPNDEARLTADVVELARQYSRYSYRRITALLQAAGWCVNRKRVARIWRREELKVPQRQPKRGRLWLADGSCVRLRPERPNHVWAYDFVEDRTHDGRRFRMLNVDAQAVPGRAERVGSTLANAGARRDSRRHSDLTRAELGRDVLDVHGRLTQECGTAVQRGRGWSGSQRPTGKVDAAPALKRGPALGTS
jgi:hypothetical protein